MSFLPIPARNISHADAAGGEEQEIEAARVIGPQEQGDGPRGRATSSDENGPSYHLPHQQRSVTMVLKRILPSSRPQAKAPSTDRGSSTARMRGRGQEQEADGRLHRHACQYEKRDHDGKGLGESGALSGGG